MFYVFDQICKNIGNTLSRHQMGCQNGYSSQHSWIAMFGKWEGNLDKRGECGALFMDLSKPFDCLQYKPLLAKLNAYGFDYKSLKLISSFLRNRKCRKKYHLLANENISLLGYHRDLS